MRIPLIVAAGVGVFIIVSMIIGTVDLLIQQGDAKLDGVEPATGATDVRLKDSQFSPRVIQVAAGTEVTWHWEDGDTPHNVKNEEFASEVQTSGEFAHAFTSPGTYNYRCTVHPLMTGRVIVAGG